jgi:hypothetical protein
MDQILPWIMASSLLLNFLLVITVGFVVYKLLVKKNSAATSSPADEPENPSKALSTTEFEKIEKRSSNMSHRVLLNENVQAMKQMYEELQSNRGDYCVDHPSEVSVGVCSISGFRYCQHCLKVFQNIKFGKKYLNVYLASEWEDFLTIAKEDDFEDVSPAIIQLKKKLWDVEQIPVIVQSHFKINLGDDSIEAFTVLKGRKQNLQYLTDQFKKII